MAFFDSFRNNIDSSDEDLKKMVLEQSITIKEMQSLLNSICLTMSEKNEELNLLKCILQVQNIAIRNIMKDHNIPQSWFDNNLNATLDSWKKEIIESCDNKNNIYNSAASKEVFENIKRNIVSFVEDLETSTRYTFKTISERIGDNPDSSIF